MVQGTKIFVSILSVLKDECEPHCVYNIVPQWKGRGQGKHYSLEWGEDVRSSHNVYIRAKFGANVSTVKVNQCDDVWPIDATKKIRNSVMCLAFIKCCKSSG